MYNFDQVIDRTNTASAKWDELSGGMKEKSFVPLTTADMEFAICPPVLEAMKQRLDHGILGYTKPDEKFYQVLVSFLSDKHQVHVEKEMVLFTPSLEPAILAGIKSCTEEQEGVILFTPVYTAFFHCIQKTKRKLVNCPLVLQEGRYEIDFTLLETLLKERSNRLMILCNPHNPIGRVWTKEEIERIMRLANEYGVYVIADEIYWDLILTGSHVSVGSLPRKDTSKVILCSSPSKTYNLAGVGLAYSIIFEEELRSRFQQEIANYGLGKTITTMGYESLVAAYSEGEPWLKELLAYIQSNVMILKEWLNLHEPTIQCIIPEGSYLAWLDCRQVIPDFRTWYYRLQEEGIFLTDGRYFGEEGEGFVRINLALPRTELLRVLKQWEVITL